jgi:hypothetical protein
LTEWNNVNQAEPRLSEASEGTTPGDSGLPAPTSTVTFRFRPRVGSDTIPSFGWLQHDGLLAYRQMNHLKERFTWAPVKSEDATP